MGRRYLSWVILLAAAIHGLGIARSLLPAQDGLQFIRIARRLQVEPWPIVVQETDRHPLYPAAIALAQPVVALVAGPGPSSWRIAAQGISALASIALLWPLFGLARSIFGEQAAVLAALLYVVLPLPAQIGHDALSDPLGLLCFTWAFHLGARALQSGALKPALACALAAACGYLTRPEAILLPVAVLVAAGAGRVGKLAVTNPVAPRVATLVVAFLVVVGLYAGLKGDVSEKLALRWGQPYVVRHVQPRQITHSLPKGLDDARWDFSAKEESRVPARPGPLQAAWRLVAALTQSLLWVFAVLALWGAWRVPTRPEARWAALLAGVYLVLFSAAVVVHAMRFGYLSERYTLSMVVVALPWAAAGALAAARAVARRRGWNTERQPRRRWIAALLLVGVGLAIQARSAHPSRWGHWAAGQWLAQHAGPTQAVLDTRGWAAFVSGRPSYDYWHVRQALSDRRLSYIVVGSDELSATSRRAATLRAILAYAAAPVAVFPERKGQRGAGVEVYRFRQPASWEGLRP